MEALTTKEFFEKLGSDTIEQSFKLVGWVKKSENKSEILFAFKTDFYHWVKIPESLIEYVSVLKKISFKEHSLVLAKLHLKTPAGPEMKTLYELLSILEMQMMHKSCSMGNPGMGSNFHGCSMPGEQGCSSHHFGKE